MWFPNAWNLIAKRIARLNVEGDDERVLKLARLYTKLRPRDPEGWIQQWRTLHSLGRVDEARGAIEEGFRRCRGAPVIRAVYSEELIRSGDVEGAEEALRPFLREDEPPLRTVPNLAFFHQRRGNAERARQLVVYASRRVDVNDRAGQELGVLLATAAFFMPDGLDLAEAILRRLEAVAGDDGQVDLLLALVLEESGREVEARAKLEELRKAWTGSPESYEVEVQKARDRLLAGRHFSEE